MYIIRLQSSKSEVNPEAETLKFFCPQQKYDKFSWAAISMVTNPLVKPGKKIKWSALASWRQMEETRKKTRQSKCYQRERKRKGVQADTPQVTEVTPLSSSSHSRVTHCSVVCPLHLGSLSLSFPNTTDNSLLSMWVSTQIDIELCQRGLTPTDSTLFTLHYLQNLRLD